MGAQRGIALSGSILSKLARNLLVVPGPGIKHAMHAFSGIKSNFFLVLATSHKVICQITGDLRGYVPQRNSLNFVVLVSFLSVSNDLTCEIN